MSYDTVKTLSRVSPPSLPSQRYLGPSLQWGRRQAWSSVLTLCKQRWGGEDHTILEGWVALPWGLARGKSGSSTQGSLEMMPCVPFSPGFLWPGSGADRTPLEMVPVTHRSSPGHPASHLILLLQVFLPNHGPHAGMTRDDPMPADLGSVMFP